MEGVQSRDDRARCMIWPLCHESFNASIRITSMKYEQRWYRLFPYSFTFLIPHRRNVFDKPAPARHFNFLVHCKVQQIYLTSCHIRLLGEDVPYRTPDRSRLCPRHPKEQYPLVGMIKKTSPRISALSSVGWYPWQCQKCLDCSHFRRRS